MTHETVGAGWIIVGLALATIGVTVIWCARSAWAENRSQRQVRHIVDLVKTRGFLRKVRNAEVPEIRLPGAQPPAEPVDPRIAARRLSEAEWDALQAEISGVHQ